MRITVATGLYPPEIGGPATYAAMLEAELPDRGFAVTVIPFGWVRRYPKIIRHFVYAYKLWQETKQTDILYALDPISVGLPAVLVAKLRRMPLLLRLGGDYAWEQGQVRFGVTALLDEHLADRKSWPLPVKLLASLQTYVAKQAVRVVVPSAYLQSVVERWGIAKENITIIYSALYPLQVTEARDRLRSQLGFAGPVIVSAGRLVPWKGFETLIELVARLQEQYPDLSLVVVGDGEERQKLEALARSLSVHDKVRFVGRVSKDALGATIKAADMFILNTAYEGLSHQLLEVMDIGTPIITTTAGGNPEIITDGVTGLLFQYNDAEALAIATRRLLDHLETRERLVHAARARSKEFDKSLVVKELIELLEAFQPAVVEVSK